MRRMAPLEDRSGSVARIVAPPGRVSPLAVAAFALTAVAALIALIAGLGTRLGLWQLRTGFTVLRYATYGALLALLLAAGAAWLTRPGSARRGFALALLALVIALVEIALPLRMAIRGRNLPAIHDITTDTANPPAFVAVAPLRADAPNSVAYGGPVVAIKQREEYPDIQPLLLEMTPDRAFQRAVEVAHHLDWEVVGDDPAHLRLEATDRTFLFGLRDDIVVRITPAGARAVIDVRSVSREGDGDMGRNAKRIREFLAKMRS